MSLTTVNMYDTLESVNLKNQPYYDTQQDMNNKKTLTDYRESLNHLGSIKNKINFICNTIGIDFSKNSLYTIITELTKLIPLVQSNYNLLLIGEGSTGKSSTYSLIFNKTKVFSGIPTTANLRGNEKNANILPLFENPLLLLEEITNNNGMVNSIPLLKTFLESRKFLKNNKEEKISQCSIVCTSNDYSLLKDYSDLDAITNSLPKEISDEAFMSRFNGILPHYNKLFYKKVYTNGDKGFHCLEFQDALLKLREIPNKKYQIDNDKSNFSKRDINKILSTINGFIKLFYIDEKPDLFFLDFITEWAIYINSLNNNKTPSTSPFNNKSIPFICELYFYKEEPEYIFFLDKSRLLFKFLENDNFNSNIFALDGFGAFKNEFDLKFFLEKNNKQHLSVLVNNNKFNLLLKLKGDIFFSKKYNSRGQILKDKNQDDEFNNLLLKYLEICPSNTNLNINFRGLPSFQKKIILKKAKSIFNFNIKYLSENCFSVSDNQFYFFNFYKLINN